MGKIKKTMLPQTHPLAKRKTLYSLENKTGEIIALDNVNFGIRLTEGNDVWLPVNLPEEFQKVGMKIRFTADVKETNLTELWAARPILLKHAEKT